MTTYIAPIGNGLGDLVVSLPAVQWLIETGERTILVVRSPRQEGLAELIPGLADAVREVDFSGKTLEAGDRYINLREHPLQTDHVWGSAEFEDKYPGYRIADIVRDICRDFGINADFDRLKPLPFERCEDLRDTVLFVPGSDGTFKCWLSDRWIELAERFSQRGIACAVVGQPEKSAHVSELVARGLPWIPTPCLRDALNVVSSARAVVSVDTGLMHLALQQLVPCAAMWINNPGSKNYSRTVDHCFPVFSPQCDALCVSEELDKSLNLVTDFKTWTGYNSWTCHAPSERRCMNNISVDTVWQAAQAAGIKERA